MNIESVVNGHIKMADGSRSQDVASYEHACEIAAYLTEKTGKCHLGVDRGQYVWPRFDVIQFDVKPGDLVSMGFNGDYYPQGTVKRVSPDKRIVTLDNEKRFFRRKLSGSWVHDRTWSLVPGVQNRRNPSF